jgi:hypothetical protein
MLSARYLLRQLVTYCKVAVPGGPSLVDHCMVAVPFPGSWLTLASIAR